MAKVMYVGDGDDCTVFSKTFPRSSWIVNHGLDDDQVALLSGNPTFKVADFTPPPPAEDPAVALQAQIDALTSQAVDREAHITDLQGQLDAEKAEVTANDAAIATLRASLEAKEAEIATLQAQLAAAQTPPAP